MDKYFEDQKERSRSNVSACVEGTLHQGSVKFKEYAGFQCTCNCFIFCIMCLKKAVSIFTNNDIDSILHVGTKLYAHLSEKTKQSCFTVKELEGSINIMNMTFSVYVGDGFGGSTEQEESVEDACFTLGGALQRSLPESAFV